METFTEKERLAQENYFKKLETNVQRKTKKPIVISMIGLIGSGKSYTAQKIADMIGAILLSADDLRIEMRKVGERYEGARKIIEDITITLLLAGRSIVIDSDFIDDKKRASIRAKVKDTHAKLIFVRTLCDRDIMIERILNSKFEKSTDDFFGGADSRSDSQNTGVIVKLREMWRRTPHHYKWINEQGGRWIPKKLNFKHLLINTNDEKSLVILEELLKV